MVNYDRDDFSIANTINLPYTIKYLDEENINKELCKDLSKLAVLDKYYIDNFGDICETENWTLPFINDEVM